MNKAMRKGKPMPKPTAIPIFIFPSVVSPSQLDRVVGVVVVSLMICTMVCVCVCVCVGQLGAAAAVDLLDDVCTAEIGTRVSPGAQAEPLVISDPPILKTALAMPGSLQQEVMFPPAEQHQ